MKDHHPYGHEAAPISPPAGFGEHLRAWRRRRRLSQLDLAADADISTRHLSYVETGRANPSREMVLRLTARLEVPLRERNAFLVAANRMLRHLLTDVDASLLQAPVNVLRLSLHPQGLAPRIINLTQWRAHLFERLSRQIAASAEPGLIGLLADLRSLPVPVTEAGEYLQGEHIGIAMPLRIRSPAGVLS